MQVEGDRHEYADEGRQPEILREGRVALGDGDQPRVEANPVGEQEGADAGRGVGRDVQGDEQAVVPPYHRTAPGAA